MYSVGRRKEPKKMREKNISSQYKFICALRQKKGDSVWPLRRDALTRWNICVDIASGRGSNKSVMLLLLLLFVHVFMFGFICIAYYCLFLCLHFTYLRKNRRINIWAMGLVYHSAFRLADFESARLFIPSRFGLVYCVIWHDYFCCRKMMNQPALGVLKLDVYVWRVLWISSTCPNYYKYGEWLCQPPQHFRNLIKMFWFVLPRAFPLRFLFCCFKLFTRSLARAMECEWKVFAIHSGWPTKHRTFEHMYTANQMLLITKLQCLCFKSCLQILKWNSASRHLMWRLGLGETKNQWSELTRNSLYQRADAKFQEALEGVCVALKLESFNFHCIQMDG